MLVKGVCVGVAGWRVRVGEGVGETGGGVGVAGWCVRVGEIEKVRQV